MSSINLSPPKVTLDDRDGGQPESPPELLRSSTHAHYLAASFGHLDLFCDVDFYAVSDLIAQCQLVNVDTGVTLLEEKRSNGAVYQIVSGCVHVRLGGNAELPLAILGAGACVGELSILSDVTASANVVAVEPTCVMVLDENIIWALLERSHQFAVNLLKVLSGRLRSANERLRHSIHAEQQSARAARIDPLTGLHNRRSMDEILNREYRHCMGADLPLCVMLIDLDHFKQINDSYGHLVGDEVLRYVGLRLANAMRQCGLVARFGGEEYAVLMPGVSLTDAYCSAEDFREMLATNPISTTMGRLTVTASIGIAGARHASPLALLQAADNALYRAKTGGRNRTSELPGDSRHCVFPRSA